MEGITNYNETLVLACIRQKLQGKPEAHDEEFVADVACIALNKLPARYVRHIVDTRFFESEDDIVDSNRSVENVVEFAIKFVEQRKNLAPDGSVVKRLNS